MAKKKDDEYWINRRAEMMYEQMELAEDAAESIKKQYYKAANYIDKKLNGSFERVVNRLGVSDKDILDIIKKAGSTSYQDILRVAKNKGLTELVEYLEQPGRKYRYERLIKQLEETNNAIDSLKSTGELETTKALKDIAESTYYKNIFELQSRVGLAFSFSEWDSRLFEKLALSKWSGKNYSKRIWDNTDSLAETLKSELIQGFIAGKTQREMRKVIMDRFSAGAFDAWRLVRTEGNFIANEMQMQAYTECGIEKYMFVATLDLRTSKICSELDGKIFNVKDAVPGVNMPPMHPFCRSTTIEGLDEVTLKRMQRRARNPVTGKNELLPAGTTYKEWYGKYVEGNKEAVVNAQAVKNMASDEKQYSKYLERMGKQYAGKSLKEFQNIKYTNPEKYAIMKAQYKGLGYYDKAIAAEPKITELVKRNAKQSGMKLVGLEHRIKEKESYLRKIATEYKPGYHYEVKDIVRYTMVDNPKKLTKKTLKSIETFESDGKQVYQVKNTWLNESNPYNGINAYIQDENGNKFEVLYHTQESFELKNGKLHELYEKQRVMGIDANKTPEYLELQDKMFDLSSTLTVPADIEEVKSHG